MEFTLNDMFIVSITLVLLFISYFIYRYVKGKIMDSYSHISSLNAELLAMNKDLEERVVERTQELNEAIEKLRMLATTDTLTDIHNRYSIMKMLDLEISRSKRYSEALSIFMYDVDSFKRVNDTYGHQAGDEILHALTKVVQNSLRDIDVVGRFGGEEFLVIMPSTPLLNARDVANRVCKEVANHKFQSIEQLTISIGLAELNSNETMDMFFSRVDKLLYKSKNSGRNRVSF